ncbi:MAG: helix-turn-helix domain-containing protein [Candidatus Omnitrophota bacterium]
MIEAALERTDGNQFKAARLLGINRNTLHAKIKKLGIEVRRWKRL